MEKIILFMLLPFAISYGQVGINTTAPTKTLDVNGEAKVRILNDIAVSNLDTNKIVVSNNDGTLGVSSLKSLLDKEGLLSYGNGIWSGIRISNSSDLIFSGELPCGETFGLEFRYIPSSGHLMALAKTNNIKLCTNNSS
jgi:hypothetical protein